MSMYVCMYIYIYIYVHTYIVVHTSSIIIIIIIIATEHCHGCWHACHSAVVGHRPSMLLLVHGNYEGTYCFMHT